MHYQFKLLLLLTTILFTTGQNEVCVTGNSKTWLDGTYTWLYFNETIKSAIYFCKQCIYNDSSNAYNGVYLYGWIWSSGYYYWMIGPDYKSSYRCSDCHLSKKTSDYVFNLDDCTKWDTWNGTDFHIDENMVINECPPSVCSSGNAVNPQLDGRYIWWGFNETRNSAIYYCQECNSNSNINNGAYLYGWISSSGDYWWEIGTDYRFDTASGSYCYLGDKTLGYAFNLEDCYYWKTWNWTRARWDIQENMNVGDCQSICVSGDGNAWLDGTYLWSNFNGTTKSAIYYCEECDNGGGAYGGAYLFGHISSRGNYYWHISNYGAYGNFDDTWSYCYVGRKTSDYVFNLGDCQYWQSWNGTNYKEDKNINAKECQSSSSSPSSSSSNGTTIVVIIIVMAVVIAVGIGCWIKYGKKQLKHSVQFEEPLLNDLGDDEIFDSVHGSIVDSRREEEKDEMSYNECVVCMDNEPQYACTPCGHYCLCENCINLINETCPICQANCRIIKIFQ